MVSGCSLEVTPSALTGRGSRRHALASECSECSFLRFQNRGGVVRRGDSLFIPARRLHSFGLVSRAENECVELLHVCSSGWKLSCSLEFLLQVNVSHLLFVIFISLSSSF